jgi:hypothetical protein
MANTKISELVVATTLDSNTQNTLFVIVDKQSGTPVTKQVPMNTLDTVFDYTNDKANSAALYANGAFIQANAAFNTSNTVPNGSYANSAFITANSAYGSQNTTGTYANAAFVHANSVFANANSYITYNESVSVAQNNSINASFLHANAAFLQSNSSYALANINFLPAVTRLNVSYTSSTAYLFDQYIGNNPTLNFLPGQTVAFDLNYVGTHSFAIRTSAGGSNVSARLIHISPTGIVSLNDEAQGKNLGILYWKVPNDLMNQQYVYQCLNHPGSMVGTINLEPNGSVVQNIANAAYVQANTPSHVANSAATYANGAFAQANAAFLTANTPPAIANSAALYANGAFVQSNAAFLTANTPSHVANSASTYANGAFISANSAYSYSSSNTTTKWAATAPVTIQAAIDRLANAVYALSSNTAIP